MARHSLHFAGDLPSDNGHNLYYFRWGRACMEGVCLRYKGALDGPVRSTFLTLTGSRCLPACLPHSCQIQSVTRKVRTDICDAVNLCQRACNHNRC